MFVSSYESQNADDRISHLVISNADLNITYMLHCLHRKCIIKENINGGMNMITVNLYYKGQNGSARAFADEMEKSGIADAIRAEEGNLRYQYFAPLDDPETILLIDSWADQAAIDAHHASPMMKQLAELREKYDLHMKIERFVSDEYEADHKFIRT